MIFKHDGSDFNIQTIFDGKIVLRKKDCHMVTLDTIQEVKAFICGYRERGREEAGRERKEDILPEWTPWEVAQPPGIEAWIKIPNEFGEDVFYGFMDSGGNWNIICGGRHYDLLLKYISGCYWKPIVR